MYVIILINDIILYISQHTDCSSVCLNWSVWCVSDKTVWLYAGIGGQSHAQGQFIIIVTYKASKPKTQPASIVGPQTLDRGFTNFFSLIFACLFQGSEHECGTDNQKFQLRNNWRGQAYWDLVWQSSLSHSEFLWARQVCVSLNFILTPTSPILYWQLRPRWWR